VVRILSGAPLLRNALREYAPEAKASDAIQNQEADLIAERNQGAVASAED
jgi:hypothetical protein